MHVLFVHPTFPAQFGHIAGYLVQRKGWRCTFVSQRQSGQADGIDCIAYQLRGCATEKNHYCSRSFENAIWNSHAVYEALKGRADIRPDLIVAHCGFLSSVFLRELYDCPIVNYFEYYYRTIGADMDYRPDFPYPTINRLRARARNAAILLDLENCEAGYSPTCWQRSLFPDTYRSKLRVIFDGVDTTVWRPLAEAPRRLGEWTIPDGMRVVTYVSRGMESIRGLDIFMRAARLVCARRRDVVFVVVGEDRICYGGDAEFIGGNSFKDWVLARDSYDLSRFVFTGLLPAAALVHLFALSDLHVYLTVPFILSWSLMDALACGATVLASDTAPVREMIVPGKNGLLFNFFDVEGLADQIDEVLDAPQAHKPLGRAGIEMIRECYSLEVCLPQMLRLYEDAYHARRSSG